MMRTINGVRDPNPWMAADRNNPNGPKQLKGHFVNGIFDDGMPFSALVMGQRTAAEETVKQLRDLIGKPGEYEGEERTTNNGSKELSLKSWPGKPQQQGGGGGFKGGGKGGWSEAYSQSREAHEITQRSIQMAWSLERATQYAMAFAGQNAAEATPEYIMGVADKYLAWSIRNALKPQAQPQQPPAEPTTLPAKSKCFEDFLVWLKAQSSSDPRDKAKVWERAKGIAADQGYSEAEFKACNLPIVFDAVKREMQAAIKNDDRLPF